MLSYFLKCFFIITDLLVPSYYMASWLSFLRSNIEKIASGNNNKKLIKRKKGFMQQIFRNIINFEKSQTC